MSKEEIQNILEDLYRIDENFRKYEKELIKIINELLVARPDTKFDENFRVELRTRLIQKAEELRQQKLIGWKVFNFKNVCYFAGALAILILLIAPTVYLTNRQKGTPINFGLQITKVDDQAFGLLQPLATSPQEKKLTSAIGPTSQSQMNAEETAVVGRGGGGGLALPAPDWTSYKYIYKGEGLEPPAETLPVYKRVKGGFSYINLFQLLNQLPIDNLDISKLAQAKIQSISLAEDKPFGLAAYINLEEGSISLNANYEKWPNPYQDCRDEDCYGKNALTINQVPADEELIKIANDFIRQFSINLNNYGEPYVSSLERKDYDGSQNYAYIPEEITVVYPQIIDGKPVYDYGGYQQGINLGINIRNKRVSSLYLTSQNYQSSNYQTASLEQILKEAEAGGLTKTYYSDSVNIIEVELGTPQLALVKTWNYQANQPYPDELIAPAYIFPIINPPNGFDYWRKNVTVFLIKDLLREQQNGPVPLLREPMPVLDVGTVEAKNE